MLTKIGVFENFGRNFNFFDNYDRHQDFIFFNQKSRFSKKVIQNLVFSKILTKIDIFENFDQNQDFRKLRQTSNFF